MSLEVFNMAQAIELVSGDMAYIKNQDTEDKWVRQNRVQLRYNREKGCVLGVVKNGTRDVYSPAWGKTCFKCQKKNPFLKLCKDEPQESLSHNMQGQDTFDIPLYRTSSHTLKSYACKLELNGISCEVEIDTGCSSSLISENSMNYQTQGFLRLRTYSGEVIIPKRVAYLNVKYKGKMYNLRVLVVPGSEPNLLRRDWLESFLIYNICYL